MTGKFVQLAQLATFLASLESVIASLEGDDIKYTNEALNGGAESTVGAALNDLYNQLKSSASSEDLETLQGKVEALEKLMSEEDNVDTAIDKFNEIVDFLKNISNTQTLEGIVGGINDAIAAKYTKPAGGIPKSDLASDVQASLGKADTALQEGDIQFATDSDILALFSKE